MRPWMATSARAGGSSGAGRALTGRRRICWAGVARQAPPRARPDTRHVWFRQIALKISGQMANQTGQTRQQTRHLRRIVVPMTRTIGADWDQLCWDSSVYIRVPARGAVGRSLAGVALEDVHQAGASPFDLAAGDGAIGSLRIRFDHKSFKEDV